jgi:hypothetical protein
MRYVLQRLVLVALIGVGTLVTGCGQPVGSPSSLPASPSSPATTSIPGPSVQPTIGQVTLTLDKQHYARGETITVTIQNELSQAIWVTDHKTSCTILTAEHLQDGQWQAVGDCRLMTPTLLVPVPDHSATTEQLAVPQASSAGGGWPSGTYRVTLTYTGGDEGTPSPGGTSGVAHSAEFTIA